MADRSGTTDDELMREVQEGDAGAFEQLVERFRGPLTGFVESITRDAATTDDVVQETFMRVYQERTDYIATGRFRGWIYTIARNLCYDAFRAPPPRSLDLDMPLVLWSGIGRTQQTESWQPDADDDRLSRIRPAAEQLPSLMREAVQLKYYHGLKVREIAEIQDCPVGTVKSRLHYALKRIEKMVS